MKVCVRHTLVFLCHEHLGEDKDRSGGRNALFATSILTGLKAGPGQVLGPNRQANKGQVRNVKRKS